MSEKVGGAALDFQRVYDDFQPRIRRYLARLGGAAEAEDLTQETFVRVDHALEGFRGDAALATWIYRIATNVATDRLRTPGFQLGVRSAEPEGLAVLGTVPVIEQDIARREMVPARPGCGRTRPRGRRGARAKQADRVALQIATPGRRTTRGMFGDSVNPEWTVTRKEVGSDERLDREPALRRHDWRALRAFTTPRPSSGERAHSRRHVVMKASERAFFDERDRFMVPARTASVAD